MRARPERVREPPSETNPTHVRLWITLPEPRLWKDVGQQLSTRDENLTRYGRICPIAASASGDLPGRCLYRPDQACRWTANSPSSDASGSLTRARIRVPAWLCSSSRISPVE